MLGTKQHVTMMLAPFQCMISLPQVLRAWHSQGHRALVFTQTQQMLDIVEKAIAAEGEQHASGNMSSWQANHQRALFGAPADH